MPDHHAYNKEWPSLPLWASKHKVEEYVKKIGLPATFVIPGSITTILCHSPTGSFAPASKKTVPGSGRPRSTPM
ncbi:hypothetical protein F5144DRAFT_564154 [Chaetomium tenue]|uniref:Uncharacterized protein n=1 Tax=Chaetomium tenue TaxID=1854479 RepID=A0ACB7PJ35_9PEZI|nr:hypothetical protein F5144DRAFT_564154 [Chaetomium globosum]